ncbi:hypothetical protein PFISCL1PPCAC_28915 [Pristionchus fissidentatus]|uniref:Uncharacterized protein n=1 Tax=Pristionchus fissidentatus TaxID=1538716 RepID=A0AAV5X3Z3_9BILA|nr:hypothetical protein PFISCL1PPCAC_28915 [Pristionchus fissidentatus]
MLGLVDYGSDSGSESENSEDETRPSGILVKNPTKGISAPVKNPVVSIVEEGGFFGNEEDEGEGSEEGSKLSLPTACAINRGNDVVEEDDIEDIAKPKEWEKKLAEKARRKLEKKATKRAEKEKKREEKRLKKEGKSGEKEEMKKKRGPVKIDAFGGLNKAAVEVEEERDEDKSISVLPPISSSSSLKLFSMLPPPKCQSKLARSSKGPTLMLPPSLRTKQAPVHVAVAKPVTPLVSGVVDSSDDDEDDADFFGLSSTHNDNNGTSTLTHVTGVPLLPSYGLSEAAGPVKPDPMDSHGYEDAEEEDEVEEGPSSSGNMKTINNEQAQNMIFKYDYAPWGYDRRGIADANIVDVSVDKAIGPNVQENLLKNLNPKQCRSCFDAQSSHCSSSQG